jgi:Flp pilus assembly protein TadD
MGIKSRIFHLFLAVVFFECACLRASAGDLRITLPKRTKPTPVQELNREGVKAVQKHHLADAEKLFYRAYLIDPDDPFTLNNLGYISELQGKVERAQRYYELASKQNSETTIDESSSPWLKGRQLTEIAGQYANRELRINHGNVQAMSLLARGRTQEAEAILQRTLAVDPKNPFTLNNLGYTMEAEGELEAALRYYSQAANVHSSEKILVTADPGSRGKEISSVAATNAKAVRQRLTREQSVVDRVTRLNLQGVSALNRNDQDSARRYFLEAYRLDPSNSFSLNNMGYVSELQGDQETADEFYAAAKQAQGANERVTLANHHEMQGLPLSQVASSNDEGAQANLEAERQKRMKQGGPIQLKTRDNKPVPEPETPPPTETQPQNTASPSNIPPQGPQ